MLDRDDKRILRVFVVCLVCVVVGAVIGHVVTKHRMWQDIQKEQKVMRVRIEDLDKERLKVEELLGVLDASKEHYERLIVILDSRVSGEVRYE